MLWTVYPKALRRCRGIGANPGRGTAHCRDFEQAFTAGLDDQVSTDDEVSRAN